MHDAANSLANAMFSVAGGDVIGASEVGDDFIWGGSGNNQLHSDVPDTSSALFEELKFRLGSTGGLTTQSKATLATTAYGVVKVTI